MWGRYPYLERNKDKWNSWDQTSAPWDSHLRSTLEVTGYHIVASDGEIGHVEDFIIDEETWAIRYLIVATTNFWPGKKILVSPQWIASVSWETQKVVVDLSRETIKNSPAYVDEAAITRDYETGLHGHYDREGYWVADLTAV
jgi:sporulation protein YlmC with PRC-barrel domain